LFSLSNHTYSLNTLSAVTFLVNEVYMQLPTGVMNPEEGNFIDLSGLRADRQSVKRAIENKKKTHLTVDRTGTVIHTNFAQAKINEVSCHL
jgi:hypothetical protein